jgi:hypothetical protein
LLAQLSAQKSSREWWIEHLQLAVHEGGCQVTQLHPAANCWQGNFPRQAAGRVLYHGQRCTDARRPLKRLHSQSSFSTARFWQGIFHRRGCCDRAAPWAALCQCEAPAEPGKLLLHMLCLPSSAGRMGPCRELVCMQVGPPGACSASETQSTLHGHLPEWVAPSG